MFNNKLCRNYVMTTQKRTTQHFTFVAKVKPGRGKNIRANAANRNEMSWEDMDNL